MGDSDENFWAKDTYWLIFYKSTKKAKDRPRDFHKLDYFSLNTLNY